MKNIEKRNEFKTMFQVGKISCSLLHDLISPITTLTLYTENISDPELKSIISPIIKSTEDIKNFIKLIQDAVEKPNEYTTINLCETIRHAVELGKHKIITNNVLIKLNFKISQNTELCCKKLEIYQIIMNLVGNAVDSLSKIRRRQKKIVITVSNKKDYLILKIKDNGSGIKKDIRKLVFNKSFTTKGNGMGIGLYTVKRIVEKSLKGEIFFKTNTNKGTEFIITFPIEKDTRMQY
jgi:signal transduction histidine kinase